MKINYKDERDSTSVYAGLKKIGRIQRVDGGWTYASINASQEDVDKAPVYSSRQAVKDAVVFSKAGSRVLFTEDEDEDSDDQRGRVGFASEDGPPKNMEGH